MLKSLYPNVHCKVYSDYRPCIKGKEYYNFKEYKAHHVSVRGKKRGGGLGVDYRGRKVPL